MRSLSLSLCFCGLLVLTGCNNTTSTTNPTNHPSTADAGFKLGLPTLAISIKQGEKKDIQIDITRNKNFTDDVTVKFEAPTGVRFDPSPAILKAGEANLKVFVMVDEKTDTGTKEVKVNAVPSKGGDHQTGTFKVEVGAK